MKKAIAIFLTSLLMGACTAPKDKEISNEDNNNDSSTVEEVSKEDKEEVRVFIQESPEQISIRAENTEIRKLSLVSLEYDAENDELVEKEILKEEEEIEENEKTTWDVIYSEGIPSMKLNWELANGEEGEYVIAYNGKDGLNPEEQMVYPKSDD